MKKIILIIIILIVLLIAPIGFFLNFLEKPHERGYTGLEKYDEARELANTSSEEVYLSRILCLDHVGGGRFKTVRYDFFELIFDYNNSICLIQKWIVVDFSYGKNPVLDVSQRSDEMPISDAKFINVTSISFDTDTAYDIALENSILKDYFKKWEKSKSATALSLRGSMSIHEEWSFHWYYNSHPAEESDIPAWVQVDARTGEVTEVITY